ncbi:T9SS type A sorting domain-containing protein [Flavobacterium sp.]|uniref:T9SS type A sorting domain-containing protein n=1 Tax=Flavobacterium sp. TaxID=239 RepID=UPI0037BEDB6F
MDKIEVYTVLGTKIKTLLKSKSIDLSEFQKGIYLLKIFVDNAILTRKVIKK